MKKLFLFLSYFIVFTGYAQVRTPAQLYPQLFPAVQMNRVYSDGKTFADAIPLYAPAIINAHYTQASAQPGFRLDSFAHRCFTLPHSDAVAFKTDTARSLRRHIDTLWSVLTRRPDSRTAGSLLPLPHPYIVPGGRFREVYYWDTYFTMLGLVQAKRFSLVNGIMANFAYMIDSFGHIPNGNRTYYLSRSQPPFFALMVALAASHDSSVFITYRHELVAEYNYWMQDADMLQPGTARRHVVKLPDGHVLNRYWDASNEPRDESYREDVLAAIRSHQEKHKFYRNVRAAAESGWDFSSRWFADGRHMETICTTSLVPVDLNCLLYQLERTIATSCRMAGDTAEAGIYTRKAVLRKHEINKYCWNAAYACYTDYDWQHARPSAQITIATSFPLCFGIASVAQARMVAQKIQHSFLCYGGVATTLTHSGQQWDRPNGWAPLQYITITGLRRYGYRRLARTIALRWISYNRAAFRQTGKLLEKYNIEAHGNAAQAGGGEYPLQDGFGWTNGVLLTLMNEYNIP